MSWNLWSQLFGVKKAPAAEAIAETILPTNVTGVINTVNTVAGTLGSTTTTTAVIKEIITLDASGVAILEGHITDAFNRFAVSRGIATLTPTEVGEFVDAVIAESENPPA